MQEEAQFKLNPKSSKKRTAPGVLDARGFSLCIWGPGPIKRGEQWREQAFCGGYRYCGQAKSLIQQASYACPKVLSVGGGPSLLARASSLEQIDLYGPLAEWLNVRGCNPRYPGSIPGRASNFPSIEGLSRRL